MSMNYCVKNMKQFICMFMSQSNHDDNMEEAKNIHEALLGIEKVPLAKLISCVTY